MVKLVKFAPLGERSAGGALSQYHYRSFPQAETNAAMNDATALVLMLETVAALENVDEIMAVDGVDMMMIGSNDLCNEMGITGQYDSPKLRDAFERAIAAARKHGKHVGVGGLASRNDLMAQFVQMGARYVSTGTDMAFLMAECVRKAKFVRRHQGLAAGDQRVADGVDCAVGADSACNSPSAPAAASSRVAAAGCGAVMAVTANGERLFVAARGERSWRTPPCRWAARRGGGQRCGRAGRSWTASEVQFLQECGHACPPQRAFAAWISAWPSLPYGGAAKNSAGAPSLE